jgi:predicted transcriptional regulator
MARKKITETVKQKVVEARKRGLSRNKIAEEFGISLSSVSRIIKGSGAEHGEKGKIEAKGKTERQKRIEELEIRIEELEKKILDLAARKRS